MYFNNAIDPPSTSNHCHDQLTALMILQPHPDSDNNMLQILSDIPEVTEEMSSTLKREAAPSNSQLSEYANGRLNCSFLWLFVQCLYYIIK